MSDSDVECAKLKFELLIVKRERDDVYQERDTFMDFFRSASNKAKELVSIYKGLTMPVGEEQRLLMCVQYHHKGLVRISLTLALSVKTEENRQLEEKVQELQNMLLAYRNNADCSTPVSGCLCIVLLKHCILLYSVCINSALDYIRT